MIENKNLSEKGSDLLKYNFLSEIGINLGEEENGNNCPNFLNKLKNNKIIKEIISLFYLMIVLIRLMKKEEILYLEMIYL